MRLATPALLFVVVSLLSSVGYGASIPELPGFLGADVCLAVAPAYCAGASRAQLLAPPYFVDDYTPFGAGSYRVGLSDRIGEWGSFHEGSYLLGLYLPPSFPNAVYSLDAVFLFFDASQPQRWVTPSAIAFADVVLAPWTNPGDLARLLDPMPDGVLPGNPVDLRSGLIVFSFAAIPEPTTIAMLGAGVAVLACSAGRGTILRRG